ncbi:MAG: hypothetical protein AAGB02_08575 [Pseudomonadota bacterium]
MSQNTTLKRFLMAGVALALATACTQGDGIESPGATTTGGAGPTPAPGPTTPAPTGGGTCPASGFTCVDSTGASVAAGQQGSGTVFAQISGQLTGTTTLETLPANTVYELVGRLDVGIDGGLDCSAGQAGTLVIAPGVTIVGDEGGDYVIVNRCSQIQADGAANNPIIFTSKADLVRQATNPGDVGSGINAEWGGLVILGRAPINECSTGMVGVDCENVIEGATNPDAIYGGNQANDSSGTLRYVQVRFAGFDIDGNGNELNGISFGGVGTGTTLDFIQVHHNLDDGVEFFGGTANISHLALTGNFDDSLDTDLGWSGAAQFVLINQTDGNGDNGMEMSGDTDPTIANFTTVGAASNAFRMNSGHAGDFYNGVVSYTGNCFRFEGSAGTPTFNSILFDCSGALTNDMPDTPALVAAINAGANNTTNVPATITSNFLPGPNETPPAATPVDVTAVNPFFVAADYLGAFGPDETETNNWTTGWTLGLAPALSCPTGTTATGTMINGLEVCDVSGTITQDLTLTRGLIYRLSGRVDVGVDVGIDGSSGSSVALAIEAGTTIFGASGADYLVVNRGSELFANGTADSPVVMTSANDVKNVGDRAAANGEWGGLVILGRAPINECSAGMVGVDCENVIEGATNPDALYGGNLVGDSSGSLQYLQVKFAGFDIDGNGNELNGISFGGVGSGTTLNHIQVHNNFDDGIEFFGGTANASNIVLTGNFDDSLDTDLGWAGSLQFLIIEQQNGNGDNAMEMSGDTDPTIANFTTIGAASNAFRMNSGHAGDFYNGVVDYDGNCFRFEGSAGTPTFNSVNFDCSGALTNDMPDTPALVAAVNAGADNNTSFSTSLMSRVVNGPNEDSATAVTNLSSINPFLVDVDYVGAVEDVNDTWWRGWTCGLEAGSSC